MPLQNRVTPFGDIVAIAQRGLFTGEVLPQFAGELDDGTVRKLLDELAEEMGRTLEQEEVHIAYSGRTWTLTAEPPGP